MLPTSSGQGEHQCGDSGLPRARRACSPCSRPAGEATAATRAVTTAATAATRSGERRSSRKRPRPCRRWTRSGSRASLTSDGQEISLDMHVTTDGDCQGTIGLAGWPGRAAQRGRRVPGSSPTRPSGGRRRPEQADQIIGVVGDKWVVLPPDESGFTELCDLDELLDELDRGRATTRYTKSRHRGDRRPGDGIIEGESDEDDRRHHPGLGRRRRASTTSSRSRHRRGRGRRSASPTSTRSVDVEAPAGGRGRRPVPGGLSRLGHPRRRTTSTPAWGGSVTPSALAPISSLVTNSSSPVELDGLRLVAEVDHDQQVAAAHREDPALLVDRAGDVSRTPGRSARVRLRRSAASRR